MVSLVWDHSKRAKNEPIVEEVEEVEFSMLLKNEELVLILECLKKRRKLLLHLIHSNNPDVSRGSNRKEALAKIKRVDELIWELLKQRRVQKLENGENFDQPNR